MNEAVLVTCATHGIGRAIRERLAGDGATVINLDPETPERGAPGMHYRVELSDTAAVRAALREICGRHEVSRLVNNVPARASGALEAIEPQVLDRALEAGPGVAVSCVNAVAPGMRARGFGRIVNVASTALTGREGRTLDSATAGALVAMTRTWALEFARFAITVNAVAPGRIDADGPGAAQRLPGPVPAGRPGRPEEVAQAVAFFLEPRTTFITGQLLCVCGGQTLGVQPV